MLKRSMFLAASPEPVFDPGLGTDVRVVLSTRTAKARVLDERTYQLLQGTQLEQALSEAVLTDLMDDEFIVPQDEDELATILSRNRAAAVDDQEAYLVIQPTDACQFGCVYCGQAHRARFMCDAHQDKLVALARATLATTRFRTLRIGWFGAEPTLAMPQIRTLTARFRQITPEFGCEYEAKLVTNGYLLDNTLAEELVNDLGMTSIEVTLDGSAEHHDRSRPTKGHGPTFARVYEQVVGLAKRSDLSVQLTVRINVSRSNREGAMALIEQLAGDGVQNRLGVYAAPLHDWGNTAKEEFGSPTEDFAAWEIDFLIRQLQLGFRSRLLPVRQPVPCMVFMPTAQMIDAYGNRFNCTEVSYVPAYEGQSEQASGRVSLPLVGSVSNRYAIGHLDREEDIPGRREIFGGFYSRVQRGEYPCRTCPMFPVCGGACPKSWVEGNAACPSAKFNIGQRLLLLLAQQRGAFDARNGHAA